MEGASSMDAAGCSDGRRRVLVVALAVLLAGAAAWVAPRPWRPGPAELHVATAAESGVLPLEVGSTRAVAGRAAGLLVELPQGVPLEGRVLVRVAAPDGRRLAPGEVDLRLAWADGRSAAVPVLAWRAEASSLEAAVRPPRHAVLALALLALVAVLWVGEAIPLFATSLLVAVVPAVARALPAETALAPFFHPVIALFLAGFLMAEALRRVGLDRRVALWMLRRAGHGPGALFAAFLGVAAVASMWMSNTAAAALLVPIAIAVTGPLGPGPYRKVLVLGIAYAATLGGVGSAIGTPANPIAMETLATFADRRISFAGWFAYGLPVLLVALPAMGWILWRSAKAAPAPEAFALVRAQAERTLAWSDAERRGQGVVGAVLVLVLLAWLAEPLHGIDAGIVALAGAVLLALLGRINAGDLGRISWSSLVTFGGGLALGRFLVSSGASDWMAEGMAALAVLPAWMGVAAVALLSVSLTAVASNTATAALLVPLALPVATVWGIDPTLLVVVVAIASSIDFAMVVGTPPTMIAHATGLFTAREIFRTGIRIDVVGLVVLLVVATGLWPLLGLVD